MDNDTSRSQTGRSAPKTEVLESHSRIASDRPPSRTTTGYAWTTRPAPGSIPRSLPAPPSSISRSSVLGAFGPSSDELTANYELRSSPRHRHANLVTASAGVQSGTGRHRLVSGSEQPAVLEEECAQATAGSALRLTPTACSATSDEDICPGLLPLSILDEMVTKDLVISNVAAGSLGPHYHEGSSYHNDVTLQDGLHGNRDDIRNDRDVLAQQTSQIDISPVLARQHGTQNPQYSAMINVQHGPAKYDSFSCLTFNSALSDMERGLQAHGQTQIDVGPNEQDEFSQTRHSGPDTSLKPDIRRVLAFPRPVNAATNLTSMILRPQNACDAPASLDTTSSRTVDQRAAEVTNSRLASMEVSRPDPPQGTPRTSPLLEGIGRDLPGLPNDDDDDEAGHFLVNMSHSSSLPRPKSVKSILPSMPPRNISQDKYDKLSRESVKPVQTHLETLQCDFSALLSPGSKNSDIDCSVSVSPLTRPGLNVFGHQDELRTFSSSSTFSTPSTAFTDVSEATHSDDTSSENEYEPGFVAIDSLMRQLVTSLLASWLWNPMSLDFHNLAHNVRKCPQESGAGEASTITRKRGLTESSSQSNSSPSRVESGDESDHEGDDQSRRRRRKIQKTHDSSIRPPRLLACPFYKLDPIRYSGLNQWEREYRKCASGTWPDISRLKQHLYRVHRRPDFCCPSCYVTFEKKRYLDSHLRERPACDKLEQPKFEEKINDEQMTEIRKKRSGMSTLECWNLIFTVLFPHAEVPESAYLDTPEREVQIYLQDRFRREKARIFSLLRQTYLEPNLFSDTDILDRMYQQCTQECTAVVTRLFSTGSCTAPPELPDPRAPGAPTIFEVDQPYDDYGPPNSFWGDLPFMHQTGLDDGYS